MISDIFSESNEETIRIKENLEWLRDCGFKETIVLEFIGTPKSGKTTIAKIMENLLKKYNVENLFLSEVEDFGSIEKTSSDMDYFIFCERIQNAIEISMKSKGIVIFDRGLFDRLVWLEYDRLKNKIDERQYLVFENLIKDVILDFYHPEVFSFVTSPNLCVKRKGKEGKVVNVSNMEIYNEALTNKINFIKKSAQSFHEICTDGYEDNLEDFSIKMIFCITNTLVEVLKSKLKN